MKRAKAQDLNVYLHKPELLGLSRTEWLFYIDEYIFNERNRMLLKRRILDGLTYERLAIEFDMSVRQIKYILKEKELYLFQIITKKS